MAFIQVFRSFLSGRGREIHGALAASSALCITWKKSLCLPGWVAGAVIFHAGVALAEAPRGSAYVPMDSWVYSSFDRLAGLGAIDQQFAGLRPWTRMQCAELVVEAEKKLAEAKVKNPQAVGLAALLKQEFIEEVNALEGGSFHRAEVESVYTRGLEISGTPLHDAFHFGQTIADDFGRPYNTGFNDASGASTEASGGRFYAYSRGEYQHSPAYAGLTPSQQAYIILQSGALSPYSQATATLNHFQLLDTYVGARVWMFDVTFGKQSLWWGPGTMGGMLYSDNIDPVPMLKVTLEPIVLPSVLRYLGPVTQQAFMGRLEDYHYPRAPYLHGEKIMVKPTPNLEVGVSRATIAFGQGIPMTFRNLASTYFSATDIPSNPNPRQFPGKRYGGFDFSYRLPYLRDWLSIYTDNISSDDVNPLVNPQRAAYNPGIYAAQLPGARMFDFRFEVANSRTESSPYTSFFYKEGYVNKGFLIGNTIGRHGSAFDASTTCWLSPQRRIQVGWRKEAVSKSSIPSGGTQDSVRVKADWLAWRRMEFSLLAQHERWTFPFLAARSQDNNLVSLGFTIYPQRHWTRTALQNAD